MATAEELLALALNDSKVLVVDNELRKINIPKTVTHLGVESDDDVLRLAFTMPKTYGEFDLSGFEKRINILNAKGEPDIYEIDDAAVADDSITFTWLVGRPTVAYKGTVNFNLCLRKFAEDGVTIVKEFNTTRAELPVLEGLEVDQAIVDQYADIVAKWMADINAQFDEEQDNFVKWREAQETEFAAWRANESAAFIAWRNELLVSDDNGIFPKPGETEFATSFVSGGKEMTFGIESGLCHVDGYYQYFNNCEFYTEADYENDRQMWFVIRYDYLSNVSVMEKYIRVVADGDFTVPLATRNNDIYELIVGAVNIPAGAMYKEEVTFIDTREVNDRCGYVHIPFNVIIEKYDQIEQAMAKADQVIEAAESASKDAATASTAASNAAASAATASNAAWETVGFASDAERSANKALEYLDVIEDAMEEAQKAQEAASESQSLAEDAMEEAQTAADSIKNMTVTMTTTEPDTSASVKSSMTNGVVNLAFSFPKAKDGSNFRVLDYYDSFSALQTAIPNPEVGAVYGVGTEEPYDIYIYGETSGWVNNGPLQGAAGEKGDPGEGFVIKDFYQSYNALVAAVTAPAAGDAYGVGTAAPYDIWVYGETTGWKNLGPLNGADGEDGQDGQDGKDGVSPTITVTDITGGHRITITDASSTKSIDVMDGTNGAAGPNSISLDTETDLWGLLKGNGASIEEAVAGTDYMAAKCNSVSVTASAILALTHAEKTLLVNSSSAVTITIPANSSVAFPVGTMINICGIGTGTVTLANASDVTLNTKDDALSLDGQYAAVTLYKAATNTWYAWGALA